MLKKILIAGFFLSILAGCMNDDNTTNSETSNSTGINKNEAEIVAENLDVPWSIEHHNNIFYISERGGTIAQISDGEIERQSVSLERPLSSTSEAGLLGFILHPNFSESKKAFAYYTYEADNSRMNRIVELTLSNGHWEETSLLLDDIPSGSTHHGGRIKIGPDEKLYATTGDASKPELAQSKDSLAGKILRLNLDGSIPPDNPFPDSFIYSYGHRNAQGLSWASDETMYASEHGANANDEINQIEKGKNYGWPEIEGTQSETGMESPLFNSGNNNTWAPSGMAYKNQTLFVAALRGNAVLRFDLDSKEGSQIIDGFGRIRDIHISGDDLYFVTNNKDGRGSPEENDDKLVRIPLDSID